MGYLYGQEAFSDTVRSENYVLAAPYSMISESKEEIMPGLTVLLEVARKLVASKEILCKLKLYARHFKPLVVFY